MKSVCGLLLVPLFTLPVIDKEPAGTNEQATPGGKAVRGIPYDGKADEEIGLRPVIIQSRKGDWFQVRLAAVNHRELPVSSL